MHTSPSTITQRRVPKFRAWNRNGKQPHETNVFIVDWVE